jgi:hypothetical protein
LPFMHHSSSMTPELRRDNRSYYTGFIVLSVPRFG